MFLPILLKTVRTAAYAAMALPWALSAQTVPQAEAGRLSPFGIGADHHTSQTPEKWARQIAAMGVKINRAPHMNWPALEPQPGQWNWADVDRQVACLEASGIATGGLFLDNPKWTNTRGLPSQALPAWSNYVTECVKHFKGKIKYWEVWNEPPNFTAKDQTPEDYAKVVAAAYDAAKAVDPQCQIGLATKSVHVNYLEQVIKAGAKDHFDYVTVHPYEVLDGIANNIGTEALYMHIVPTIRRMLAAVNPEKANAPIWFTELGVDAKKGLDTQAHAMLKAYVMGIAQGVACINWFECMDGDSGPMGLLNAKGEPRPSYHAYRNLVQNLGAYPEYLGWALLNGKHYAFAFQGAKGTVLAAWAWKGVPETVDFGQPVDLVDPLSGQAQKTASHELTKAPILVLNIPAPLLRQAKENKGRPLPWAGDYSQATSVSLTPGEKDGEKGLHTQSGDAVAAAVVAYGGSARAGSIPRGNMFIVDPSFLSYTATPIEITAVVRRNEANDNAGFKLVYESNKGFKSTAWYTVPDNQKWHTVSWKIDDAQFVNYWGYNFSLVSDGNQYNKYYLQSVTVKKLAP